MLCQRRSRSVFLLHVSWVSLTDIRKNYYRNCKARKVKCGEEKPRCSNCERLEEDCDYKIRLSWGGRPLKKKQMLNGEEQTEDESMFLPGAGQFSIHQQFPQQQTFVPQAGTNGTPASRKPPVVRAGRKSGGISSYQNVFSVAEPAFPGPPPVTPTSNSHSPEEHPPPGSSHSSASPPARSRSQSYYQPWSDPEQSQTSSPPPTTTYAASPITATHKQEPYESENVLPRFAPQFPPITTAFASQIHSPQILSPQISSPTFPSLNLHSAVNPSYSLHPISSPHHHQPPQQSLSKSFHPPPMSLGSPTKRLRRSASPPNLPTPHSLYYQNSYSNGNQYTSHASSSQSLGAAIDFMNSPFNSASMANTAQEYDLPSMSTPIMNNHVRSFSVASILAPQDTIYSYSNSMTDIQTNNHLDDNSQTVTYGVATSQDSNMDDDDVEEIPRIYDLNGNGFGDAYRYRMTAASMYKPRSTGIPRSLEPMPPILRENMKNRMYFKHFLNFTARLLVPHDCSENPFKMVLPQSTLNELLTSRNAADSGV